MTRREEILQHAIECGCIEGTAEYYGFLQGAEWSDRNPKSSWISVEERLPEESRKHKGRLSDTVFVVTNQSDGTSAIYDHATKTWCPAKILRGHITHWMSIPELQTTK